MGMGYARVICRTRRIGKQNRAVYIVSQRANCPNFFQRNALIITQDEKLAGEALSDSSRRNVKHKSVTGWMVQYGEFLVL